MSIVSLGHSLAAVMVLTYYLRCMCTEKTIDRIALAPSSSSVVSEIVFVDGNEVVDDGLQAVGFAVQDCICSSFSCMI